MQFLTSIGQVSKLDKFSCSVVLFEQRLAYRLTVVHQYYAQDTHGHRLSAMGEYFARQCYFLSVLLV